MFNTIEVKTTNIVRAIGSIIIGLFGGFFVKDSLWYLAAAVVIFILWGLFFYYLDKKEQKEDLKDPDLDAIIKNIERSIINRK